MKRRTYKTKRLTLRPYRLTDYPAWAWAYKNVLPRQSRHDWIPSKKQLINKHGFGKMVRRQLTQANTDKCYIWAIFEKKSKTLIGIVDVAIIERRSTQFANLGYRIINRYWREGFATEALESIIPNILVDLKLNRLEAVIDLNNKASINLVKAVGLKREGIRKKYYYKDRAWADQIVYVAVREVWGLRALHL